MLIRLLLTRVLDGIAQVFYVLIHTETCPAKSTSIVFSISLGLDLGYLKSWSWSWIKGRGLCLGIA